MSRVVRKSVLRVALVGVVVWSLITVESAPNAQEQAPASAPGGVRGRRVGGGEQGRGGGRGGPVLKLSALRSVPAETTVAKVKDPSWKAPRTSWGHPPRGQWRGEPRAQRRARV